jgi:glycosyltransferase involved in cell wall biosynthesis
MATGTPILAGHNSGMAEMVTDGSSGYIFTSGDQPDLTAKLETFLALPYEKRRAMAEAAHCEVREKFSQEKTVAAQEAYFARITGLAAPGRDIAAGPAAAGGSGEYKRGLVSVVIPCFNHGGYIREAIAAVRAQTYSNFEIIIVNDGSTDTATVKVLEDLSMEEPDLKIIHQDNMGLSAARNTGIRRAEGEYILPLDADDLLEPEFLEATVAVLEREPEVGFVYTWVKYFGAVDGIWETPEYDPDLLLVQNICTAASLFRHEAFDRAGGYRTDMVYGFEDWDFWIYLMEAGWTGKCVDMPLFLYRKHQSGSMLGNSQKYRDFLVGKITEHHLDTFKSRLPVVLAAKDKLFFDSHMEEFTSRQKMCGLQQELSDIYNSKAWKWVTRFRKLKDTLLLKHKRG